MSPRAIAFDLETGGVEPHHPDIQLAAVAFDTETWAELETFETKIQFDESKADPKALELNHYSAADWSAAPTLVEVVSQFTRFIDRHKSFEMMSLRTGRPYQVARLVGHNAATFDGPRLKAMFTRHGRFLPADMRVRDTCQRALWYFDERPALPQPENFKLATLCRYFGIPVADTHEAMADVRLTIALARALSQEVK